MNKTIGYFLIGATVCLAQVPATANAQTIPPACEQYLKVMRTCGPDLIRLTALTHPDQEASVRASLSEGYKKMLSALRTSIKQNGETVVAERCASSPGKEQLQSEVTNMVTILAFGHSLSDACQVAYSSLR